MGNATSRTWLVDQQGRPIIVGPAEAGDPSIGGPVIVGGVDASGDARSLLLDSQGRPVAGPSNETIGSVRLRNAADTAYIGTVADPLQVVTQSPVTVTGSETHGTAPTGNPVLTAGWDGASTRIPLTDVFGRQILAGAHADGSAWPNVFEGSPVHVSGHDGANHRMIKTDNAGNQRVVGPNASGTPTTGAPVLMGIRGGGNAIPALGDVFGRQVMVGAHGDGVSIAFFAASPVRVAGQDGVAARSLRTNTQGRLEHSWATRVTYSAGTTVSTATATAISGVTSHAYLFHPASSARRVSILRILVSVVGGLSNNPVDFLGSFITAQSGGPGGFLETSRPLDRADVASQSIYRTGATGAPTRVTGTVASSCSIAAATTATPIVLFDANLVGRPLTLRASQNEGFEVRSIVGSGVLTAAQQVSVTMVWVEE